MRILTENEKRYESIMMLEEASKKDIKSIKNHYKFKYRKHLINIRFDTHVT